MNEIALHTHRLRVSGLLRSHLRTRQQLAQTAFRLVRAEQELAEMIREVNQLCYLLGGANEGLDLKCFCDAGDDGDVYGGGLAGGDIAEFCSSR